jgi:hypothetical protein
MLRTGGGARYRPVELDSSYGFSKNSKAPSCSARARSATVPKAVKKTHTPTGSGPRAELRQQIDRAAVGQLHVGHHDERRDAGWRE